MIEAQTKMRSLMNSIALIFLFVGPPRGADGRQSHLPPAICDQTSDPGGVIAQWQTVNSIPYPVKVGVSWKETSLNPITTNLAVNVALFIDIGQPWADFASTVKSQVDNGQRCEVNPQFTEFRVNPQPDSLSMHAGINVNYYLCAFNRTVSKLGDQQFSLDVAVRPVVVSNVPQIQVQTSSTHTPLPNNVVNTFDALGVVAGFSSGLGVLGGVFGGRLVDGQIQGSYQDTLNKISDTLQKINGNHSFPIPGFSLIQDYNPSLYTPTITIFHLNGTPPNQDGHAVIILPLRIVIPPDGSCSAKQSIQSQVKATKQADDVGRPLSPFGIVIFPQ